MTLFTVFLMLLAAGSVRAQTPPPYTPDSIPAPPEQPSAMLGALLYQQNCAPCHGMTGAGDGPQAATLGISPKALNDPAVIADLEPAAIFHLAKYGSASGEMPAFQNFLDDSQLWRAVFYALSLHTDADRLAAGRALYAEQCASCHGLTGQGDGPDAGAELTVDFSDRGAMNARSQAALDANWQAAHADLGADWNVSERQDVLDAIRAFTYLTPWESPYQTGDGAIGGRIVQGTAGADLPAAQEMTLMAYMNFTPVATFTTTTDVDGAFTFEQVSTDPGVVYYVGTRYDDIAYGSELFSLSPLTATVQMDIPLYETTADASQLRMSRVQWVVDHRPGELRVRQILAFANDQDRTVVGAPIEGADRPVTAVLPIPKNAIGLEFQDGALGARYQRVGDVVYDTSPIRPGAQSRQILLGYTIPYDETSASFTADFGYPVDAFSLLVADLPDLTVDVSQALESVGNQTLQGVAYRVWDGKLADAQPVDISMQNLIPPDGTDPRQEQPVAATTPIAAPIAIEQTPTLSPVYAGLIVGALVLVIGGGALYWKYSRDKRQTIQSLMGARERLLTEIASLDDRHAQGELDDETWSGERVTLMRALRSVTDNLERQQSTRKGGARG